MPNMKMQLDLLEFCRRYAYLQPSSGQAPIKFELTDFQEEMLRHFEDEKRPERTLAPGKSGYTEMIGTEFTCKRLAKTEQGFIDEGAHDPAI